jgi:uncharacterized protein (TIGR00299 family) protein
MRIAYLDCFAGISGDMFLGALLGAGVPASVLIDAADAMQLGVTLKVETVDRSGISATKVHVLEGGKPADRGNGTDGAETHSHVHAAANSFEHQHSHSAEAHHTFQPQTQHLHKTGHPHTHEHTHDSHSREHTHEAGHTHGRSLTVIRGMIQASPLAPEVKSLATRAFELLGASEAKIHNVPLDEIHFHEVGAVDAIIDIVAASAGIVHLNVGAWHSSPVNVGGGTVECAHGTFPVPAPATADLLRGVPTYSAHIQKELVTPTGAALLRAIDPTFGPQPAMAVEHIGYGAGTRNPPSFPNVLRLSVGEAQSENTATSNQPGGKQQIAVIETAIDDATPQLLAYVAEQLLAQGALDVMLTPVIMKKGRPGTLVTVLAEPGATASLEHLLLRELPTLGVRTRTEHRSLLDREHRSVETPYGTVRVKLGRLSGEILNATPEYEDCRKAASQHNVPLKQVQQAALARYASTLEANRAKA